MIVSDSFLFVSFENTIIHVGHRYCSSAVFSHRLFFFFVGNEFLWQWEVDHMIWNTSACLLHLVLCVCLWKGPFDLSTQTWLAKWTCTLTPNCVQGKHTVGKRVLETWNKIVCYMCVWRLSITRDVTKRQHWNTEVRICHIKTFNTNSNGPVIVRKTNLQQKNESSLISTICC